MRTLTAMGRKSSRTRKAFALQRRSLPGVWTVYGWPKPGEKESSRKVSYHLSAQATPYVVSAGIYDDNASIAELSKLTSGK
jgi:signal transduction histidine kinase